MIHILKVNKRGHIKLNMPFFLLNNTESVIL